MSHPDVEEYEQTLELVRTECVGRMRERAERAKRLLRSIIHGEATADEIVDAVTERKRH